MSDSYQELVVKLERVFGAFNPETRRFEKAKNSLISRNLGYSDSQFSRLINNTATDNEYHRAIQNIDRILKIQELEALVEKEGRPAPFMRRNLWKVLTLLLGLACIIAFSQLYLRNGNSLLSKTDIPRDHTLKWVFESSFINPFVRLDDLPSDCDYPCYKYQGKWKLEGSYKIPFFRERNGFHYVATEVEMYSRCMTEQSDSGDVIEGYEYQKHEIWYDQQERGIGEFMVDSGTPSKDYQSLDFNKTADFIKVANIHTFFRNEFFLNDSSIRRKGKVIGRDMELVPRSDLKTRIRPKRLDAIEIELQRIMSNRMTDFSVPIACSEVPLIKKDPADIEDGDKMAFHCQLTTNGYAIEYVKTYILEDQYIKNDCISKESE